MHYIQRDHSLEKLDALVHGLECIGNVVGHELCIDIDQRLVHPALLPTLPVSSCLPQISVWLKIPQEATHFVILATDTK